MPVGRRGQDAGFEFRIHGLAVKIEPDPLEAFDLFRADRRRRF